MRKTKVKRDNKWVEINFEELQKDELFKMYDGNQIVVDSKGRSSWIASSFPYQNQNNAWAIEIYEG